MNKSDEIILKLHEVINEIGLRVAELHGEKNELTPSAVETIKEVVDKVEAKANYKPITEKEMPEEPEYMKMQKAKSVQDKINERYTEEPEPEPEKVYKIEDIQKALAKYAKEHTPKEAKEILFNFNVKTLKELSEDDYPVIMEQLS